MIRVIGTTEGRAENQFAQPRGICVNPKTKEIFIVDCNNSRIQVYHLNSLAYIRTMGNGNLTNCVGICMDDANQLFVADTNNHRIVVFNQTTGAHLRNMFSQGSLPGYLFSPYGVCVDCNTGCLFIADYDNHRVQVFCKETGEYKRTIGLGHGAEPGQLNQPIVLAIDADTDRLFVADYGNDRVQIFCLTSGMYMSQIGSGDGTDLKGPRGLCIDSGSGLLFISDRENHRIQIYQKDTCVLLRYFGHSGIEPGQFNRPMEICICVEDGVLLVVDGFNHRVQVCEIAELLEEKAKAMARMRARLEAEERERIRPKASRTAVETDPDQAIILGNSQNGSSSSANSKTAAAAPVLLHFHWLGPLYNLLVDPRDISLSLNSRKGNSSKLEGNDRAALPLQFPPSSLLSSKNEELVSKQADNFMSMIADMHSSDDGLEDSSFSSSFLVVPAALALHSLLERNWKPRHMSLSVISSLTKVLGNLSCNTVNDVERKRAVDAITAILASAALIGADAAEMVFNSVTDSIRELCVRCSSSSESSNSSSMKKGSSLTDNSAAGSHHESPRPAKPNDHMDATMAHLFLVAEVLKMESGVVSLPFSSPTQSIFHKDVVNIIFGPATVHMCSSREITVPLPNLFEGSSSSSSSSGSSNCSSSGSSRVCQNCSSFVLSTGLCSLLEVVYKIKRARNNNSIVVKDLQLDLLQKAEVYFNINAMAEVSLPDTPVRTSRGTRNVWRKDEPIAVGDLVDAMDKEKSWYESIVTELRPGMNVKVHFMGWGSKWDDVISIEELGTRIAPLNTKTSNWRLDLFEGGLIDIKCNEDSYNQKWIWGRILAMNIDEAWIDVSFSFSNEPTMVKRVDLWGETICPVGMHTKEKSKAAAATVVRPPKRANELMRGKQEESFTEEAAFWDREDDMVDPLESSSNDSQQQPAPLLMRAPTIIPIDSFSSPIDRIALIMFESIMLEVISAVTERMPLRLEEVPEYSSRKEMATEGEVRASGVSPSHRYTAALKVLLAIGKGPFKRLLAPYFCRVLTVHCGLRAKISVSASLASATNDIVNVAESLASTSSLMQRVRGLESLYCELLIRCLGDTLSLSILRRMLLRLQTTVTRCAVAPIANNFIARATSERGGLPKALVNDFLKSDRFSSNATELRKVLSKIFQAASQSDLVRVSDVWKDVLTSWLHTECFPRSGFSISNQEEHYKSMLSSLIKMLDKARSISRLEFQETNLCHMAADEAFKKAFSSLPTCAIMHLSKAMAVTISSLLDQSEVGICPDKRTKMLECTCDFLQTVLTEKTYGDFKCYYELLLSRRLLHGRFTSLSSEKSVLANLPVMPKACFMIRHFELGQRYMIEFRKHLMTRVDADLLEYSPSIKLALEPGGKLNICVISGSLWPIKCVSPSRYSALSLPRELEVLTSEFGVFFDSLDFDMMRSASLSSSSYLSSQCATPRRLFWCFGAGSVTLACRLYDQKAVTIVVNEPQAAVLLAYNKRANACFPASELCKLTNLSEDLMQEMLKTLCHPSMPFLEFRNSRSVKGAQSQNQNAEVGGKYFLSESLLSGMLGRSCGEEEETLFVSQSDLIDVPIQEWKNTTIDACIVKVLKQTARDGSGSFKGLEGIMVIETALSAYQTALIVRQKLKAAEKTSGLVSTEEILERCKRLVEAGYIERLGGGSGGGVDLNSFGFSYLPESSFSPQSHLKSKSVIGGSDEGEHLFRHMLETLSINNNTTDHADCVVDESLFCSAFVQWIAETQLHDVKQTFPFPLKGAAPSLTSNNKRVFDKIDGPSSFSSVKSSKSNIDTFCCSNYGEQVFHNASHDVDGLKYSLIYTLGACVSQIVKLQMQHHSCFTSDRCCDVKSEEAELERYTNALGDASSKIFSTLFDHVDIFQTVIEQLEPELLQAAFLFLEAIEIESSCSEDKEGEKPMDQQETPINSRVRANWNIKRSVSVAKLAKFGHAHFSDDFVTVLSQIGASNGSAALHDQLDGDGMADLQFASKSIFTSPAAAAADEEAKFTYPPQLQPSTSAGSRSAERDDSSSSKHDPPVVNDSVIFLDLRDVFLATMEVARINKKAFSLSSFSFDTGGGGLEGNGSGDPFRGSPIFFGASRETATTHAHLGYRQAPAMIFPDVNFFNAQVFPRPSSSSSSSSLDFFPNKTEKKRSAKGRFARQGLQMVSAAARRQQQQQLGEKQAEFFAPTFNFVEEPSSLSSSFRFPSSSAPVVDSSATPEQQSRAASKKKSSREDEKQSTEVNSLLWQLREYLSLCRSNFEQQFATLLTNANDIVKMQELQYQEQQSQYKEEGKQDKSQSKSKSILGGQMSKDEAQLFVPLAALLLDKVSALVAEDAYGSQSRADDVADSKCEEGIYSIDGTQSFEPLVSNMLKAAFRSMSSNGFMSVTSFSPGRHKDGSTKAEKAEKEEVKQMVGSAHDEETHVFHAGLSSSASTNNSPSSFSSNFSDFPHETEELDASSSSWTLLKDDQKNTGSVLDYNFPLANLAQGEDEESILLACKEQLSTRINKLGSVLRESNMSILSLLASSEWDVRKVLDVYCGGSTAGMFRPSFLTMSASTQKSKQSVLFQSICAAFMSTSQRGATTDATLTTDPMCVQCSNARKPADIIALFCHHWCCKECWKSHFTSRAASMEAVQDQEKAHTFVFVCVECNTVASPDFVSEIFGKLSAVQGEELYKAIFEDQAKAFLSFMRKKRENTSPEYGARTQEAEKEFAFQNPTASSTFAMPPSSFRFGIAPLCSFLSFSNSQVGDMQACREAVASMRLQTASYKAKLNEPLRRILVSCLLTLSRLSLTGNQRNLSSLGVASDLAHVMKQYCLVDPEVAEAALISLNSFCFGNAANIRKVILGLDDDEHSLFLLLEWYSEKKNFNIRLLHLWSSVVCDTLLGKESSEENRKLLQHSFGQHRLLFLNEFQEDERTRQAVAKIRLSFF